MRRRVWSRVAPSIVGGLLDRLRDRVEVVGHHPDAERDREDEVRQDQPEVGIDEAQGAQRQEKGHHHRGRGDHLAREDRVEEQAAAAESEPGEPVSGHDGDHEGERSGARRDHQRVHEVARDVGPGEHVAVVAEGVFPGQERRRDGPQLPLGLDGAHDHPEEGEQGVHRDQQQKEHHRRSSEDLLHSASPRGPKDLRYTAMRIASTTKRNTDSAAARFRRKNWKACR